MMKPIVWVLTIVVRIALISGKNIVCLPRKIKGEIVYYMPHSRVQDFKTMLQFSRKVLHGKACVFLRNSVVTLPKRIL